MEITSKERVGLCGKQNTVSTSVNYLLTNGENPKRASRADVVSGNK